ncbi:MAG: hypothetical protein DWQ42_03275 [Planctomycetota bacterium]|nr:MAG: hypothetical protein DWQ42_03275 [Planctomycetota bacterium]
MARFSSSLGDRSARTVRRSQYNLSTFFAKHPQRKRHSSSRTFESLEARTLLSATTLQPSDTNSDTATFAQIIDNSSVGFSTQGEWGTAWLYNVPVFGSDFAYAAPKSEGDTANWTFTGLPSGSYHVSASWGAHEYLATNAIYTIHTDAHTVARAAVNQQQRSASDVQQRGANFQTLATSVNVVDGQLVVQLHGGNDGFTMADAVRIERIGDVVETGDEPIFSLAGPVDFSGDGSDYELHPHTDALEIAEGTVSVRFTADEVEGWNALFSKDAHGTAVGGHLTAFVVDGRLKVRFQSTTHSKWFETAAETIEAGQEYHFAFTFGEAGAWLYLDGLMRDWNTEFDQGLDTNDETLVIGANIWGRSEASPYWARNAFSGSIEGFTLFDTQYDRHQVADLAGVEPDPPLEEPTVIGGVLTGTLEDDTDLDAGAHGVYQVYGDYGNDTITGNNTLPTLTAAAHNDAPADNRLPEGNFVNILRGGHGNDTIVGSDFSDLIVSFADGREPTIVQEWDASDDPYGEIDPESNTHFPGQPIEGDDVFTGGGGADLFYFRTLINAKERIILEHVDEDGTIHWGGVAGENRYVHDHWVDGLGDELITDFNREEGDHILIEGHTTEVYQIEYVDSDLDGTYDSTVLHVWSNQGNGGGAHNKDRLGTITAAGVLLTADDFTVNQANYGIVPTIAELDEALTPYSSVPDDGIGPEIGPVDDGDGTAGVALSIAGPLAFSGEEQEAITIEHHAGLEVADGTIAFRFTADEVEGWNALFSKDAHGTAVGGHLTAFVVDGRLKVRFQSTTHSKWFETAAETIEAGQEYHFAFTFGEAGAWLYLDGLMRDWNTEFDQGLDTNDETLVIGANIWGRSEASPYWARNAFSGSIEGFTLFDTQYDRHQVADLAGVEPDPPLEEPTVIGGVLTGTLEDDTDLDAGAHGVYQVYGDYGNDTITGNNTLPTLTAAAHNDAPADNRLPEGNFVNILRGGHGNDTIVGSDFSDLIVSFADGREPTIVQEWDASDDPYGEIDPESNTHFPGQPIEGDDVFTGGGGADLFYFRTLINAKERIILEHVDEDGTIHWGGVAGENRYVHDHWVDGLGDELITDFNREEGDHILIEGHTTEVYQIEYVDSDLDGTYDSTVLHVWSNQGNGGGAHNKDRLGTITAAGVLLTADDFTVNQANYGIVPTIAELDEALTPYSSVPDDGIGPEIGPVDDGDGTAGVALSIAGPLAFSGEEQEAITIEHHAGLEVADGTIAFRFTADEVEGWNALFSKDAHGTAVGGHLTAFVVDGRLKVRFQSVYTEKWIKSDEGSIAAGESYDVVISFGANGYHVALNGERIGSHASFTQGLDTNDETLVIGANIWARSPSNPYWQANEFTGTISDFTISATTSVVPEPIGEVSSIEPIAIATDDKEETPAPSLRQPTVLWLPEILEVNEPVDELWPVPTVRNPADEASTNEAADQVFQEVGSRASTFSLAESTWRWF